MSYIITPVVGIDLTDTPTTGNQASGSMLVANDGVYQYGHANGALAVYNFVKIDEDWELLAATTTLLPSTEPAAVGAAQVAFADNDYGWVMCGPGLGTGLFAASCAQDVKIYTTAVAGVVDDSATTLIQGLKLITTITSATSAAFMATQKMVTISA